MQQLDPMLIKLIGDGSSYASMMEQAASSTSRVAKDIERNSTTIQKFTSTIKNYASGAVQSLKSVVNIGGSLTSMAMGSVGGGAVAGLMGFGGIAGLVSGATGIIQLADNTEKATISFETMLGTASAAKKMLADITDYAAKTPFEMPELRSSAQMMLQFGMAQDKIMPTLKALGNVAGGDAAKLNGLTYAFSQMQSTGRLMGQDLMQMINWGFNPLQEMSRKTGKSMAVLKGEMEAGRISAKMVEDAFISAAGPGGRFFGLLERQSQTVSGLMSTLADTVKMQLTSMGEEFIKAVDLKYILQETIKFVEAFMPVVTKLFVEVLDIGKAAFAAWTQIFGVFKPLLKQTGEYFIGFGKYAKTAVEYLKGFYRNIGTNAKILYAWLGENWSNVLKDMLNMFVTYITNMGSNLKTLMTMFTRIWSATLGWLSEKIKQVFTVEFLGYVLDGIVFVAEKIRNFAKAAWNTLKSIFTGAAEPGALDEFISTLKRDFKRGAEEQNLGGVLSGIIKEEAANLKNPLEGFVSSIAELPKFKFMGSMLPSLFNYGAKLVEVFAPEAKAAGVTVGQSFNAGMVSSMGAIEAVKAGTLASYETLANYRAKMALPAAIAPAAAKGADQTDLLSKIQTGINDLVEFGKRQADNVIGLVDAGLSSI